MESDIKNNKSKEKQMAICETPSCEENAVTSKLHPIGGEYCAECAINLCEENDKKKINEGKTNAQEV